MPKHQIFCGLCSKSHSGRSRKGTGSQAPEPSGQAARIARSLLAYPDIAGTR